MKIHTWKEIINKNIDDIPGLVQIIKTKEGELKNLLKQENSECPLNLRWKAYDTFKKTKKEILATLHILDKLWYTWKEWMMRKISNVWPFITFNKVDYNTPKKRRELKEIAEAQEEILKRKDIDRNELNKFRITI